ncbi:MAG: NAD-dependent DNA ligase LigA [Parasporobacterium sp.]|nr:NAD-dependent DNA ligase LigA [Parasporobacterium sp.]
MSDKEKRIDELIGILNEACKAYYTENREIMSNFAFDALYDELVDLEAETGIVKPHSPTQNVGYQSAPSGKADKLLKERHETPMLSLGKTKSVEELAAFLGDKTGLLSWKLDGLTIVLHYEGGKLVKAVTRGNGEIGEIVTDNARYFVNIPGEIPYKGRLVIRGEAVIKYSDFEEINKTIADGDAKYKNPRNLCSGSVRQLDPEVTKARNVNFFAFSLESAEDIDFKNSNAEKFRWLSEQGFEVVSFMSVTAQSMEEAVKEYFRAIPDFDIPSDGLVLLIDDIAYGKSLGITAKYPRHSIAFKWRDEAADTVLREVEWSPSRTGLINPVAIFDPVELEGTTVSRASLHNISIIEGFELGIGDTLSVYKANMIIPQIAENKTKSGGLEIPSLCPSCHGETVIKNDLGVKTLTCPNEACPAKQIKAFSHYVSRNCMNIDGISEETLEKFIGKGFISDFTDIYHLDRFKDDIINMQGFGEKSYGKIIDSVETSRTTQCARLVNALGINGVGQANAKILSRFFNNDIRSLMDAEVSELTDIENVGAVIAGNIKDFFSDDSKRSLVESLLKELTFAEEEKSENAEKLAGLTFVITGSLESYINRDALKAEIESMGGKVAGSVSSKTSYLINNDLTSTSGKNKTAKSLGIPIISEAQYIKEFKEDNQE